MARNVGYIDRIVRIVISFAILSLVLLVAGPVRWLGLIGLVPLITGIVGWCPAYTLFHVSSCHARAHKPT